MVDDEVFSKTIKVARVQDFKWEHSHDYVDSANRKVKETVLIQDIQAIYVNPKWQKSEVGDCLTFDKKKKKKNKEGTEDNADESTAKAPQIKANIFAIAPSDNKNLKKKKVETKDESESSDMEDTKSRDGGVTLRDFKQLKIPENVMKDGMLFIWVEKEFIS